MKMNRFQRNIKSTYVGFANFSNDIMYFRISNRNDCAFLPGRLPRRLASQHQI